jgi:tRNA (guanine37-N1)-methyltransferase
LTLFPEIFPGPLAHGLAGKALEDKACALNVFDIRGFAIDRYGSVDDDPFGGGAGMVMRADVVGAACTHVLNQDSHVRFIFPTPRGKPLSQKHLQAWATQEDDLAFLCGRYEGVDQRVIEHFNMEEVSLGDFILMGGEVAVCAMLEGTIRLLPNVLGNADSLKEESFAQEMLEYPQYTRPRTWCGRDVPDVLLTGNHQKIKAWRQQQAEELTRRVRPDLNCQKGF